MLPVFLSIGKVSISSFGVFLALGFLVGIFLIWRLSRAWDLDEEKVLDLTLLTFLGGLIGSRLYFVLQNLSQFSNVFNILFVNKVPGFSFWGAFLGGWLTLFFFSRKRKIDFWQIGDIASVGFLGSLILADLGCFLGGCEIGVKSNWFFAVEMVGFLGKRFPVQLLEAILLFFVLIKIWSSAIHFHPRGKIVGLSLIWIGAVKFLLMPFKTNQDGGVFFSLILCILGIVIFYKVTKRNLISDLKRLSFSLGDFVTNSSCRQHTVERVKKYCYNQMTLFSWKIRSLKKTLRRFNVKFSYKNN